MPDTKDSVNKKDLEKKLGFCFDRIQATKEELIYASFYGEEQEFEKLLNKLTSEFRTLFTLDRMLEDETNA